MTSTGVARSVLSATLVCLVAATASTATAQTADRSLEVGGHASFLRLSELETTDSGIGASLVWRGAPQIALDGSLTWFPGSGDAGDSQIGDQDRLLGLVGVRSGVTRGRLEPFGRARVGFLRFAEHEPVICILIFPPPLACRLAGGYTAFAADIGGGLAIAVDEPGRLRLLVEVSDLLVRYGVEAQRPNRETTDGFTSHNLLVTTGLAWRF